MTVSCAIFIALHKQKGILMYPSSNVMHMTVFVPTELWECAADTLWGSRVLLLHCNSRTESSQKTVWILICHPLSVHFKAHRTFLKKQPDSLFECPHQKEANHSEEQFVLQEKTVTVCLVLYDRNPAVLFYCWMPFIKICFQVFHCYRMVKGNYTASLKSIFRTVVSL